MRAPMVAGGVSRQSSSYRQGLVLGLTMAEIMLLLVFCLLIATGVLLSRGQAARKALEQELRQAKLETQANRTMAEMLEKSPQLREALEKNVASSDPKEIDAFWRKLVESAAVADALAARGMTREKVLAEVDNIAKAEKLRADGVDLDKAARNARLVAEIDQAFKSPADDETILKTVANGLASREVIPGHRWPPIIKLSEADGFFFESGRAELSGSFEKALETSVVSSLLKTASEYYVDVIEVVGHTDEQPVGAKASNLDRGLQSAISNRAAIGQLRAADNAGLGLARAIAVVSVLSADARLSGYKILPLSGAQLIQTDETLARGNAPGDVRERRRIEIRLRKSAVAAARE